MNGKIEQFVYSDTASHRHMCKCVFLQEKNPKLSKIFLSIYLSVMSTVIATKFILEHNMWPVEQQAISSIWFSSQHSPLPQHSHVSVSKVFSPEHWMLPQSKFFPEKYKKKICQYFWEFHVNSHNTNDTLAYILIFLKNYQWHLITVQYFIRILIAVYFVFKSWWNVKCNIELYDHFERCIGQWHMLQCCF